MRKHVTIGDIADYLGISRNTVSRALNGNKMVSEKTKEKILETARVLGYGVNPLLEPLLEPQQELKSNKKIVYVTRMDGYTSYFFASIINTIENYITHRGASFNFAIVRPSDIASLKIPSAVSQSDGVICADIFQEDYLNALFSVGLPVVLIDSNWDIFQFSTPHTAIMMENDRNVEILTDEFLLRGHENIAFVGDPKYCRGFYERYRGYVAAHVAHNLLPKKELLLNAENMDSGKIKEMIKSQKTKATAFVCANDYYAISVIRALNSMRISIPDEAEVVGFDNLPESEIVQPMLTTVHTFTSQLGKRAARAIFDRIDSPNMTNEAIYLPTVIRYRESTKKPSNLNELSI